NLPASAAAPAAGPPHPSHPRLEALVAQARERSRHETPAVGLVYACDALALEAAARIAQSGIARPVLIGPRGLIERAADSAAVDVHGFEIVATGEHAREAAGRATALAH